MLDKIIKYGLYSLVFLLPLFFLPWTIFPVALNKQMLLAVFVFLLFILWMIKVMIEGKLTFVLGKLTGSIFLLFVVLAISTIFSSSKIQSFWGMSFESDTLFSFILYILVFFLFANLISVNQLKSALISFLTSSGILALLFLIQIFKPIFPWDFTQSTGFNPVGSVQGLGIFLGGAFVILMASMTAEKNAELNAEGTLKQKRSASSRRIYQRVISVKSTLKRLAPISPIILGILLFLSIFIINYWVVWLGIAFGLAIIIFRKLKNISRNQFTPHQNLVGGKSAEISGPAGQGNPLKLLFLPLFIFALALVFIFLKLPVANIVNLPSEISPTYSATFDIAKKTLEEGPKNLILGSGPATFGYQYSLHRGVGPNLTDFWQVRFDQGATAILTFLTCFGILGILVILLMMAVFFYQGFKSLIGGNQLSSAAIGSFVGSAYYLISWFFYPINLSLLFTIFLMLGLWMALTGEKKEFLFTQSPQKAFLIMLLGTILIVASIIGVYTVSQKYLAALNYTQGIELINAETPKLDESIIKINKAAQLDPKDIYFRNLSQEFLFKISEVLNNQELSQEQKQKLLQQTVSNAELSANNAVLVNPKNSQNLLQLGNVYENLDLVNVTGAGELALLNYQKAAELDPQNPQIPLNLGRVYKTTADKIKIQIAILEQAEKKDEEAIKKLQESYDKNLELALEEFKKSAELKSNFSAAYYLTAQVYEVKGEKEKALENYKIVLQLEPGNEEIKKKIEALEGEQ